MFLASLQASRQGIPHTPTLAPWPYADGWSAQPLQIPRKRTGKLLDEVVVHDAVKRTPSGPRRSAFAAASAYRYNVEFGMFGSFRRPLCSALLRHRPGATQTSRPAGKGEAERTRSSSSTCCPCNRAGRKDSCTRRHCTRRAFRDTRRRDGSEPRWRRDSAHQGAQALDAQVANTFGEPD